MDLDKRELTAEEANQCWIAFVSFKERKNAKEIFRLVYDEFITDWKIGNLKDAGIHNFNFIEIAVCDNLSVFYWPDEKSKGAKSFLHPTQNMNWWNTWVKLTTLKNKGQ